MKGKYRFFILGLLLFFMIIQLPEVARAFDSRGTLELLNVSEITIPAEANADDYLPQSGWEFKYTYPDGTEVIARIGNEHYNDAFRVQYQICYENGSVMPEDLIKKIPTGNYIVKFYLLENEEVVTHIPMKVEVSTYTEQWDILGELFVNVTCVSQGGNYIFKPTETGYYTFGEEIRYDISVRKLTGGNWFSRLEFYYFEKGTSYLICCDDYHKVGKEICIQAIEANICKDDSINVTGEKYFLLQPDETGYYIFASDDIDEHGFFYSSGVPQITVYHQSECITSNFYYFVKGNTYLVHCQMGRRNNGTLRWLMPQPITLKEDTDTFEFELCQGTQFYIIQTLKDQTYQLKYDKFEGYMSCYTRTDYVPELSEWKAGTNYFLTVKHNSKWWGTLTISAQKKVVGMRRITQGIFRFPEGIEPGDGIPKQIFELTLEDGSKIENNSIYTVAGYPDKERKCIVFRCMDQSVEVPYEIVSWDSMTKLTADESVQLTEGQFLFVSPEKSGYYIVNASPVNNASWLFYDSNMIDMEGYTQYTYYLKSGQKYLLDVQDVKGTVNISLDYVEKVILPEIALTGEAYQFTVPESGSYEIQTDNTKFRLCRTVGKEEIAYGTNVTVELQAGAQYLLFTSKSEDVLDVSISTGNKGRKNYDTLKIYRSGSVLANPSTVVLQVGKSTKLFQNDMKANGGAKSWKSSKKSVVTVSKKGKLTAKKVGTATISITLKSGIVKKFKVKVQNNPVVTKKLELNKKKITLKKGKNFQLITTVTPVTSPQKVTYESSEKKVATVSSKGLIKAKKKGTTIITVTSGKKKVKCTVKVK